MIKATQLDSGFAQAARQGVDHLPGKISMEPAINHENFRTIRETYLLLLEDAEQQAHQATATPKPKSIRRRIFEWLEQG